MTLARWILGISLAAALPQLSASASPIDDPLPRRAWLGTALEVVEGGARIREIMPGSSAEGSKLNAGDVLTKLGDLPVTSPTDVVRAMRKIKGGDTINVELLRDGEPMRLELALKEWPREEPTDAYGVEYADVASAGGRLRTITLVPKGTPKPGQKRPALLVIQGLGAASLDNPKPGEPIEKPTGMGVYRTIADALAARGFVVARVDKGGCGDSEGDPTKLDFNQELDGYRQALQALGSRPDVDRERIFIFGHSMGGVFGPMLAAETPVRGVAVYGTLVKTWLEYLAENHRRQALLAGTHPADLDRQARALEKFNHELLVDKKSPEEVVKEDSSLAALAGEFGLQGDQLFGRHYTFFQQLHDVNLPEFWAKSDGQVLALWGEAEYVSGRDDHELIAAIVNAKHEGQGAFAVVKQSDHGFSLARSPAEAHEVSSQSTPGAASRFNPEIIRVLDEWLTAIANRPPSP